MVPNTLFRRSLLLALILAGGGFSLYANAHGSAIWRWTILNNLHYFLAGFLLADILEGHRQQPYRSAAWDAVSLIAWPIVFLLPRGLAALAWLPILIVPLYLAAFYGPASNWFFRRPFVALGGGMCYSIYLMHVIIIMIVAKATNRLAPFLEFRFNFALRVALESVAISLLCTLYYVLIERPCMDPDWPRKLWRRIGRGSQSHTPAGPPPVIP
jgi:peptidoglycan/LPS O-acetylase OafA/YrhL